MGQLHGRPKLNPVAEPITNLPRRSISNLWQVFNDIADGFGVSRDELEEICADLKDVNGISRIAMIEKTDALFAVLDTDGNGLIDALEYLSVIAVISGMRFTEIIEFILTCYDFDGTQLLSIDEVTLALRSTASGLCKLCSLRIPREELIEQLVATIFADQVGLEVTDSMRLRISVLTLELNRHPDIRCWFAYFGSPHQSGLSYYDVSKVEIDHDRENPIIYRKRDELDAINWSIRCEHAPVEINSLENPWIATVALLTPFQFANQTMRRLPPDESLGIEWIYGYQGEKSRNNVRYNFQGDLVYHVSKYGIVYSFTKHEQTIFSGHTDEILCLAMHPGGQLVATGEAGPFPSVIVWDSTDRSTRFVDSSFHRNGVIHVCFSPNGKLLAAVGNDPKHTLTVYLWGESTMLYSSEVDAGNCLACTILIDGTVVVGGDSYLYFWSQASDRGTLTRRRGNFSKLAPVQPMLSLAQIGNSDSLVSGTTSGQIFLWVDCNCVRIVRGHEGPVNCLYSCSFGVLSGSRDNRVRLWTHRLEPGATFDCSNFGILPCIRSVCMSSDGTSILIGTRGANIFEISAVDGSDLRGGPLACGHSSAELTAIAAHPSKHEYATVGNDRLLRICDMNTKTTIKLSSFDAEARTVTYSPLGDILVVGFGGTTANTKSGAFVVLNELDMSIIHEAHDSASSISVVLFSPDGETLAVGVDDGAIFLYSVQDEYELIGRCLRHATRITQMDFSLDGEWLRSNSLDRELCFFNADDGSYQSNMASMRDVQWATSTCLYTWHTKALHRTGFKNEIVTCCQNNTGTASAPFLAAGTSFGYVRLNCFPCIPDDSECHRFPGHVNAVSGVRFSFDSDRIISTGLYDRCVIQWRRIPYPIEEKTAADFADGPESEDFALEAREGSDIDPDFMLPGCFRPDGTLNSAYASDPKTLPPSPAIDIWRDSVVAPVNLSTQNTKIPDVSIRLEAAYGYKCQDLRNSVRYTNQDSIVYVCATIGVVMSRTTRAQRFFQKHTDSISAFAYSRQGDIVATGQIGHTPIVSIWDVGTCEVIKVLPELHLHAVCCLKFSANGNLLAVVSLDRQHSASVYDWRSGLLIARFFGGTSRPLDICFVNNDQSLIVCGIKEIMVWSNIMSRTPTSRRPVLGDIGFWQPFLCCVQFGEDTVIGTSDGNLYVLQAAILKHAVKAHRNAVSALDCSQDGQLLVTGGKDGAVRVWNQNFDCIKEITVDSVITSHNVKVRSVNFNSDASNILIATQGAEIFEVVLRTGALVASKQPLVHGHGTRELWGLSPHPTKEEFVTSGDDSSIRVWDSKNCNLIRTIRLDAASRAIAFSPDGRYCAVGFGFGRRVKGKAAAKEGAFVILSGNDFRIVHEGKDSNEPIRVVKFSPDSKILAIASDDAHIYTYNVKDSFSRRATIATHRAPIHSLDFSMDGSYLFSVDSTHRMVFSEVASGINIPSPAALRDERWSTWSSPVGWPIQGMWLSQPAGCIPSCAQRSWNGMLLALANSNGRVMVSHYPCPSRAGFVSVSGHGGPISQVAWMAGDGILLTIGRKDHAILQWRCYYDDIRESGDEGGLSCQDSVAEVDAGFEGTLVLRKSNAPVDTASVITPPSDIKFYDETAPSCKVVLDFVHGVRIRDARQMIRYNQDGNIVSIASTFGVIYSRDTQSQLYYRGHSAPVISMDVTASGLIAATGDSQEQPEIHVWDVRTGRPIILFSGLHRRGITSLCFSQSSRYLVSLGQDSLNSIVVLQSTSGTWVDGVTMFSCSVSHKRMFWVNFVEGNSFPVVCGGTGIMYFIRAAGHNAEKHRAEFGKKRRIQSVLCSCIGDAEANGMGERLIVTGTVSGHLYVWNCRRVLKSIAAHDSSVYSITRVASRYATAGKDGFLKIWSGEFGLLTSTNLQCLSPSPEMMSCLSLRANGVGTKLVLGMRSGEVYEYSIATESTMMLIQSHSKLELHGISANPVNSDEYATSGDDGFVRVWSIQLRKCVRRVATDSASRAVCWSPDGSKLIVGIGGDPSMTAKDGAFFVLHSNSLDIILEDRKAKKTITCIKYSPSGHVLGMGSKEGKIFLHSPDNFSLLRVLTPAAKRYDFCLFDFSVNSETIRAACSTDDISFFDVENGSAITLSTATRDLLWSTCACPLTWLSQGIRRPPTDNVQILSTATNPAMSMIAASYQDGSIRLFRYPSVTQWGNYVAIEGVATQCGSLAFSSDGKYLLVLDSAARIVLQYLLVMI